MRREIDVPRIYRFMECLGLEAKSSACVYLTGGATALLFGWRGQTMDIDLRIEPEEPFLYRALPRLKQELDMNIELASPQDFIPELPGWRDRSDFIASYGKVQFYHYDFYAQALSKIERAHQRDLQDVQAMQRLELIQAERLLPLLEQVRDRFGWYPAIDFEDLKERVEHFVEQSQFDA